MFENFTEYNDCEPAGLELPKIDLTKELLDSLSLDKSATSFDVLKTLARRGIKERGIDKLPNKKEYYDRAKYELDIFDELGFADYVLLNWDVLKYGKDNGYPIGLARGSSCGSLILYLLRIVEINPIECNLLFERFVSRSRAKKIIDIHGKEYLVGSLAPDVDTDIAHDYRQLLVDYIERKHRGRTSKILTYNTFSTKVCIKEAAKFFDEVDEEEANRISDMIPKEHGINVSLAKAYEESDLFADWCNRHKKTFEYARMVRGLNKNSSVHPSGIAICSQDIKNVVPLQLSKDGDLITGYDMHDVADLMVKFDILGLRTLSIAERACQKAGIKLDGIDPEDPFIYDILQDFQYPCGLFQISAPTNFQVAQRIKPKNLRELSDVIAIARPAALSYVDEYIKQKENPTPLGINDKLDKLLAPTKNIFLFQEIMMRACSEVFGMTLDDAENLRKSIGKKDLGEIAKWKKRIFDAAEKENLTEETAEYFWKSVKAAGNYAFNLSHSRAYSALAAKTLWLKHKYPKEFFCAILEVAQCEQDPLEVIAEVNRELLSFDIRLLPPSLEDSSMDFKIVGQNIRYGFSSIKGISEKLKERLEEFVKLNPKNKYEVFNFAQQSKINVSALSSLIYAGALGETDRAKKVLEARAYNLLTPREKRNFNAIGEEYDYLLLESIIDAVTTKRLADDGRPVMKETRFETFKKKFAPLKALYLENKKREKLSIWWFEKSLLGYSFTLTLRDCFNQSDYLGTLGQLRDAKISVTKAVVQVEDFFVRVSKAGNRYMRITIADDADKMDVFLSDSPKSTKLSDFLDKNTLKKKDIVIIEVKEGQTTFIESLEIVDARIFTKAKDLT